jgi:hypothetical protein
VVQEHFAEYAAAPLPLRAISLSLYSWRSAPREQRVKLLRHLSRVESENGLVFFNRNGRPYSANKLREKQLHPILLRLGIPRGGFHAARHGATSEMIANGVAPTVIQKQMRHSDARITLGTYGHQSLRRPQQRTLRLSNPCRPPTQTPGIKNSAFVSLTHLFVLWPSSRSRSTAGSVLPAASAFLACANFAHFNMRPRGTVIELIYDPILLSRQSGR